LKILELQENRCLYCEYEFGEKVMDVKKKREIVLRIEWDHVIPWAYTQSHNVDFAAACQICNRIKTSHVYDSIDDARLDIGEKRKRRYVYGEKRGQELPEVWSGVQDKKAEEGILRENMPQQIL